MSGSRANPRTPCAQDRGRPGVQRQRHFSNAQCEHELQFPEAHPAHPPWLWVEPSDAVLREENTDISRVILPDPHLGHFVSAARLMVVSTSNLSLQGLQKNS